jgi:hypothetical protein
MHARRAVDLVRRLGYDGWAKLVGYGRLWAVETTDSTFKRVFGGELHGGDTREHRHGADGKVSLYNALVNM